MNLVERVHSQAVASRLSGIALDVLRDWRKRGILDGWGEEVGPVGGQTDSGRWAYSFDEIIMLSIMRVIDNGQPIRVQAYMAARLLFFVLARFRPDDEIFRHFRDHDATFPLDANGHVSARISPIAWPDNGAEVFAENAQAIVVNIAKLIDMLPAEVKNLLDDREDA